MGIIIISSSNGRDRQHWESAARWIGSTHPDIAVRRTGDAISLESKTSTDMRMQLIWQTAVLNERFLADGAAPRASILDSLIR